MGISKRWNIEITIGLHQIMSFGDVIFTGLVMNTILKKIIAFYFRIVTVARNMSDRAQVFHDIELTSLFQNF